MSLMRKLGIGLGGIGLAGALVWALWPQPTAVDLAPVIRAPMQGVVAAQGVTRVRAPYAITAPISGTTTRSPVEVGDSVIAGQTEVAVIQPADPALMDARSRAQAEAAVAEAEAAVALAEANLMQADSALAHSQGELDRAVALADRGLIARRMLEDIQASHEATRQARQAAQSQVDLHRASLARAEAQLMGPVSPLDPRAEPGECCLRLLAPQTGIVLEVTDRSARPVQAGSPLLVIGNLDDMEIELDLLSADAVRVPEGARAEVDRWGGEGLLEARLRRIEPAAFTRVSALGIEEQRVRLRLDLLTPPEDRPGLGEGFRVHLRLILWEEEAVLQVPQAALFRQGEGWALFTEVEGRAVLTPVVIGRQSGGQAELLEGPPEGAQVVLYPASSLSDGAAIRPREG